jgi:ppGpp synthetase/RelA/SpoT-type nucleotidyltranferase
MNDISDVTSPAVPEPGDPLAYSPSQIRRAGDRIRRAVERGEAPSREDLQLLNDYRAWHQPTLEDCQRQLVTLFHEEMGLDPENFAIAGRPLKTVEAITAKLVRNKMRLTKMQDIAGTRVVIPSLELQDSVTKIVVALFADKDGKVVKDTREEGDDFGYRAIHAVATLDGRFAEVQVRTAHQDVWAQIVERTDKMLGTDLKHGEGPTDWLEWLLELSEALRERDLGRLVPLPPTPHDLLQLEEESTE